MAATAAAHRPIEADRTFAQHAPRPAAGAPARALLIDPDPGIGGTTPISMLRQNGVEVDHARSDAEARQALAGTRYQVVILENASPEYDGEQLCTLVLHDHRTPLLLWTRSATSLDQVAGLELGADDVVAKTAHPLELVARTRRILRRDPGSSSLRQDPDSPCWVFNFKHRNLISSEGRTIIVRSTPSKVLAFMCRRAGQVIPRQELEAALAPDGMTFDRRTIDVYISRLRRIMNRCDGAGQLVRSIYGTGYLLDAAVEEGPRGLILRATP